MVLWAIDIPGLIIDLFLSLLTRTFLFNLLLKLLFFVFFLIYLPVGWQMLKVFILSPISRTELKINRQKFQLRRWLLGWCFYSKWYDVENRYSAPTIVKGLMKRLGSCKFGSFLTQQEQNWLVEEIQSFLANLAK